MEKQQNRRKLLKKLKNSYRLLIINETNLQEKTSLSLTPSNVILIGSAGLLMFSIISWAIYALFPSVKDYTPGYGQSFDGKMKNEVLKKLSRLENELLMAKKRELAMKQIISGEEVTAYNLPYSADPDKNQNNTPKEPKSIMEDPIVSTDNRPPAHAHIEIENTSDLPGGDFLFFTPLKGKVNIHFDNKNHPSVDMHTNRDEFVRATMDGTVIFSGWTPEYGYIITLQHLNNWLSIYKFNSALYKELGSFVKAGETIGITGYTDKDNPIKQLRFELWHNGIAVNPTNYIVF